MSRSIGCAPKLVALVAFLCLHALAKSDVNTGKIILDWKQINVDFLDGPTFSVMVEPEDTVENLVRRMQEIEGIPLRWITTWVGGIILDSDEKFYQSVRKGSKVTIGLPKERLGCSKKFVVTTPDNIKVSVATQLNNTVASLKDEIFQETHIPQGEQRLLLNGKELRDEWKLGYYDIDCDIIESVDPPAHLELGRPLEDCDQIVSIDVKTLSSATIEVEINLAASVNVLKEEIRKKTGVPTGVQRLFANSRGIAGADRLCDLGLVGGTPVYMTLRSAQITNPNQVSRLQKPPVPRFASKYEAPIFREVEDTAELAQKGVRVVSYFKDARNWDTRVGLRLRWERNLFDPVAHLAPNLAFEEHRQFNYQSLRLGPHASESQRMAAAILGARVRLSSAVRPYRVAANLSSVAGITLGGGSTGATSIPLGADLNNWAPDTLSDSDVMRLFEVVERVRQALVRNAQTGEPTLSIAGQRQINHAILSTYIKALAGLPISVVHDDESEGEDSEVCMDKQIVVPTVKLPNKYTFSTDSID